MAVNWALFRTKGVGDGAAAAEVVAAGAAATAVAGVVAAFGGAVTTMGDCGAAVGVAGWGAQATSVEIAARPAASKRKSTSRCGDLTCNVLHSAMLAIQGSIKASII